MPVDFTNLRNQVLDQSRQRVERATRKMTEDLKRTAPVDTGNLQRKTGVEVETVTPQRITAEARIDTDYAAFVTMGTSPHVINAKPNGVLVFNVGSQTVFTRRVNHPGTQANPFYDDVVNRWPQYLRNAG